MIRVYFNRAADYPLVWSVDHGPGTTEMNFREVVLEGVTTRTVYRLASGDASGIGGEDLLTPRAWIEITGEVQIIVFAVAKTAILRQTSGSLKWPAALRRFIRRIFGFLFTGNRSN